MCGVSSGGEAAVIRPVGVWAIAHATAYPEHVCFNLTVHYRWLADPVPGAVAGPTRRVPADGSPQEPVAHQVKRPAVVRRFWNQAVRFAGPLYLAGVSAAMGAVLALAWVSRVA
jgi:hypothetical protein